MAIFTDLSVYSAYGEETIYGTAPATVNKCHGILNSVTPNINNNEIFIYGVGGGRQPLDVKAGILEASVTEEFKMQDGAWLKYVLGAVSGAGTYASPYAYVHADAYTSLTKEIGQNTPSTAISGRMLGSVCQSAKVKCALKEPVVVTLDFIAQSFSDNATFQTITPNTNGTYMFYGGGFYLPSGSLLAEIDSVEFQMLNHAENYYQLGTRNGVGVWKNNEYLANVHARVRDNVRLHKALGGASTLATSTPASDATMKLAFTDGNRFLYLNYANAWSNTYKGTNQQGDVAYEDIAIMATGASASEGLLS
jgi:hypothetical protein